MTTLTRFTPAHDILTIRDLMERMFDETLAPVNDSANVEGRLTVDAYTTQNEIVVQAALPGVKPEEVEITVENDTLKISAELPKRLEDVDYAFVERPHGRFSRTLMLNVPVEADKGEAHFDNGLLTLTLPKAESVKPKMIKVKAK
ncbi:MAG: Hsp20/alpha crystallin family protein [Chloroflexi bacterium]|nr:Hsp20/alpha crystallin family protein [Chloroflexota bacterium]MBI5712992.1 Hsp20/alpha crystallin family protein [Chloroflexota bacterium]